MTSDTSDLAHYKLFSLSGMHQFKNGSLTTKGVSSIFDQATRACNYGSRDRSHMFS